MNIKRKSSVGRGLFFPVLLGLAGLTIVFMNDIGPLLEREMLVSDSATQHQISAPDCTEKLQALDDLFDTRRHARQTSSFLPLRALEVMDVFEPEAVCLLEERFGGGKDRPRHAAYGDGPKFTCGVDYLAKKAKEDACLIYNVGSNNQIDFEVAVHKFVGCEVYTFDPTLAKPYIGGNYSEFRPWGIGVDGDKNEFRGKSWTSKGIETIQTELDHQGRKIDILKIDCEGCEWDTLPIVFDAMARGSLQIDQILVELHPVKIAVKHFAKIKSFFEAADKAGLRVVHKERNHWGCQGYMCLEYAFVHEEYLRQVNGAAMGC